MVEQWQDYFDAPIVRAKANAARIRTWTGSVHNRPQGCPVAVQISRYP